MTIAFKCVNMFNHLYIHKRMSSITLPIKNILAASALAILAACGGGGGGGNPPVAASGVVTTLAGTSGSSGSADGTSATALFNYPRAVAVDSSGNVYVADLENHTIRKIASDGAVTTFAGTTGQTGSQNGTGTAASFNIPSSVAVDSSGNVYVADSANNLIRKITSAGEVTTLAGTVGEQGSLDGTGTAASFNGPSAVAVDSSGNVYVADYGNSVVRKITSAGEVTTLAGTALQTGSTDGTGADARFVGPSGIAVDSSGNVYVSDSNTDTIRKITSAGVVTTLAGTAGESGSTGGSTDGTGAAASFNQPQGVAVDSNGTVYVADYANVLIRKITSAGVVTTFAGTAGQPGSADGTGAAARFNFPYGIAVDSSGYIYVADTENHTIRKITP